MRDRCAHVMARYDFRCPRGHLTTLTQSMTEPLPATLACGTCERPAERVYEPPAAIHFKGRGFYATDVKGAQERRRRPNPADDLARHHDPAAARIARSL